MNREQFGGAEQGSDRMSRGASPGRVGAIEPLEPRRLLAAGAGSDLIDPLPTLEAGVLRIRTGDANDHVVLTRLQVGGADEVRVVVNDRRSYFATSQVLEVNVFTGAGDDRIEVGDAGESDRPLATPLIAYAGAGDDTLLGGAGNDRLRGQDGADSVAGSTGDDLLEGGAGNDTLLGGRGDDDLYGNQDNDFLADDRGDNVYSGGAGRDSVKRSVAGPADFVIGVWGQPSRSAWHWKARGLNTMVAAELMGGRIPMADWDAEVTKNGLNIIRQPSADLEADGRLSNLIAWLAPDEPDVHKTDPRQVMDFYSRLKAANPDLPVFLNFSGGHVVGYQDKYWKHPYDQWVQGADWVSNDIYPVTGWNLPRRIGLVGHAVDELRAYAPEKPQFAFIETSDQELAWVRNAPGVNPAQFRAEIWNAVIHGVRGIIYFPQQFNPKFEYDMTPPEIIDEMKLQNARLKDLSPILLSPIEPKGYGIELPAGMEGTWRTYRGKTYFIVLNMKSKARENATIKFRGVNDGPAQVYGENRSAPIHDGQLTDTFEGYTPRVYVVG